MTVILDKINAGALALQMAALLAAFATGPALGGTTLYKSIAADGRVTYSDKLQPGAVSVEEIYTGYVAKPVSNLPMPYAEPSDTSNPVRRANAAIDAAERALALARQPLLAQPRGLFNVGLRASDADLSHIEHFKGEVARARQELATALQRNPMRYARNAASPTVAKTVPRELVERAASVEFYSFSDVKYPVNSR